MYDTSKKTVILLPIFPHLNTLNLVKEALYTYVFNILARKDLVHLTPVHDYKINKGKSHYF